MTDWTSAPPRRRGGFGLTQGLPRARSIDPGFLGGSPGDQNDGRWDGLKGMQPPHSIDPGFGGGTLGRMQPGGGGPGGPPVARKPPPMRPPIVAQPQPHDPALMPPIVGVPAQQPPVDSVSPPEFGEPGMPALGPLHIALQQLGQQQQGQPNPAALAGLLAGVTGQLGAGAPSTGPDMPAQPMIPSMPAAPSTGPDMPAQPTGLAALLDQIRRMPPARSYQ